jgi:hypothetical protein
VKTSENSENSENSFDQSVLRLYLQWDNCIGQTMKNTKHMVKHMVKHTQQKVSAGGQGDRGKSNDQQTDFFGGGVPSRKTEKHVEGEVQG